MSCEVAVFGAIALVYAAGIAVVWLTAALWAAVVLTALLVPVVLQAGFMATREWRS